MSPGDGSYDAIGLMKQLGEQTAGAFADAQKVLGDETPETIMKGKCATNDEEEKEENHNPNSASTFMVCLSSIILRTNSSLTIRIPGERTIPFEVVLGCCISFDSEQHSREIEAGLHKWLVSPSFCHFLC